MRQLLLDVRELFSEQVHYRELLVQMTLRDLLLRYKQTVMGFGWAVFMPLVNTAVFSVIFTRIAPIDTTVPYPVFAYCGLLAWNLTASSLRFAVNSLTSNTALVTKVYFPREIFPLSSVLVCFVDFAVGSIVLIALMAYYGVVPGSSLLYLPIVMLVHLLLTCGAALFLAMANLFYRDVKYLFEIFVTVWMFATPVLYPMDNVNGIVGQLLRLNPMAPVVDGYRAALLYGQSPLTPAFLGCAAASLAFFGGAWLLFHRAEFQFAESV